MIGIYKITNKANGKIYVGKSIHIEKRWEEHISNLNNKNHHSIKLQRAWNKYGRDSFIFEIECECNREDLNVEESKAMLKYNSIKNGYNMIDNEEGLALSDDDIDELKTKYYNEFLSLIDGHNTFSVGGELYNERFFDKQYDYNHYRKCISLVDTVFKLKDNFGEGKKTVLRNVYKRPACYVYFDGYYLEFARMSNYDIYIEKYNRVGTKWERDVDSLLICTLKN